MATPTFVAEDADALYSRILKYEIDLLTKQQNVLKEESSNIESAIDGFKEEYNTMYISLKEFDMADKIANISDALRRIEQLATMRVFLNNSNSNSGLNENSNNNMSGGKKRKNTRKNKKSKKSRKNRNNK